MITAPVVNAGDGTAIFSQIIKIHVKMNNATLQKPVDLLSMIIKITLKRNGWKNWRKNTPLK